MEPPNKRFTVSDVSTGNRYVLHVYREPSQAEALALVRSFLAGLPEKERRKRNVSRDVVTTFGAQF